VGPGCRRRPITGADLAGEEMAAEGQGQTELRDRLAGLVLERVKDAWVNGSQEKRLPGSMTSVSPMWRESLFCSA